MVKASNFLRYFLRKHTRLHYVKYIMCYTTKVLLQYTYAVIMHDFITDMFIKFITKKTYLEFKLRKIYQYLNTELARVVPRILYYTKFRSTLSIKILGM